MKEKTVLICPDSYKGSMSAAKVASILADGLKNSSSAYRTIEAPMSDGGEGMLDCVKSFVPAGEIFCETSDVYGKPMHAEYLLEGNRGYFETAKTCGLENSENLKCPVSHRLTHGLGLQMQNAMQRGCKEFYVGLGGSCTNDAGIGLLQALGVQFCDQSGNVFLLEKVSDLSRVEQIRWDSCKILSPEYSIILLSDVSNPLLGENGATAIYGPQKGVAKNQISELESLFQKFTELSDSRNGVEVALKEGAGAAGGLGFALLLCGGEFRNGARFLMEKIGLHEQIESADFVITGEGRTDRQSLQGKLPMMVADLCKSSDKKAYLVSAVYDPEILPELLDHFHGCFSILSEVLTLEETMRKTELLLRNTGMNLGHIEMKRK